MDFKHIVSKINRRSARRASLWHSAILFCCVFAGVGLFASVAAAFPFPQPVPVVMPPSDSDVLADCMNGARIKFEGSILTCHIKREVKA